MAASVGPYGLTQATQATTVRGSIRAAQVADIYRPRVRALLAAMPSPDLLAYETTPNTLEVDAIVALQAELGGTSSCVLFQAEVVIQLQAGARGGGQQRGYSWTAASMSAE